MKHCTLIPIKDQKAMYDGGVKSSYSAPQYRAMLLMLKVSKVHTRSLNTEQCYSCWRCQKCMGSLNTE